MTIGMIAKTLSLVGYYPRLTCLTIWLVQSADMSFSDLRKFYEATVWPQPLGVLVVGRCYDKQRDIWWYLAILPRVVLWVCLLVFSWILIFCLQRKNKDRRSSKTIIGLSHVNPTSQSEVLVHNGTWFLASQDDHAGDSGSASTKIKWYHM